METIKIRNRRVCIETAKKHGCPNDQIGHFFKIGYVPLPWQWEFHSIARQADKSDGPIDIGLGGARGPGKSHAVLSQAALDDCQRIPGLKGLFLRQTGVAAQESFDDLIDKVVRGKVNYKKSGQTLRLGDSRIVMGGFKDAKDIDKYIGIEYDFIIVEELNQLTLEKYTKLRGSLRTSKPSWRPRMYTSFNPGGLGHKFVRDRYIVPHRKKEEIKTRFVGSTYKDNPHLNVEYTDYLEGLTGDLGRAWREGDWDLFAGQVFHEFRHALHVMKTVVPNANFDHYLSKDWGYSLKSKFASYASVVLQMKTDDGQKFNRVITYNEWAGNQINPEGWAEKIYKDTVRTYDNKFNYEAGYCDAAMFSPGADGSVSIAQRMMTKWDDLHGDNWTVLKPGTRNRLARVATTHDWLSMAPDGRPYWLITENCKYLIDSLPLLIYNDGKGKKDDVDTDSDDHGYDSISYFLTQIKFIGVKTGSFNMTGKVSTKVVVPRDKQGNELAMDLEKWGDEMEEDRVYNESSWKF